MRVLFMCLILSFSGFALSAECLGADPGCGQGLGMGSTTEASAGAEGFCAICTYNKLVSKGLYAKAKQLLIEHPEISGSLPSSGTGADHD